MVVLDGNEPVFSHENFGNTPEQNMKLDPTKPITVTGFPQSYAWGKVGVDSLVGQLLPNIDPTKPYAELWFGCHPNGPSEANQGATVIPLKDAVAADPKSFLGNAVAETFGPALPFLFKILSVGEALSIQTHPTKEQAELLHREKPDLYRDSNHKPEIAVAVTPVQLFYGFRSYAEIVNSFTRVVSLSTLVSGNDLGTLSEATDTASQERIFKKIYSQLISTTLTSDGRRKLSSACDRLVNDCRQGMLQGVEAKLVLRLAEKYPSNVGLFAPFLMDIATIPPGQALYTEPGVPHAYLSGDMIEVMANSDNVVRAGLTPKPCDVATLIDIVNCRMGAAPIVSSTPVVGTPFRRFPTPAAEFEVQVGSGKFEAQVKTNNRPELLFSLDGEGILKVDGVPTMITKGQAMLISAQIPTYELSVVNGSVYRVVVP